MFATINGINMFYHDMGEGDPLVLLHAGIADSRMWDKQLKAFAEHYRVIAPDLRGFGQTEIPNGEFAHYRDVYALLQHLGIDQAHFVGASMSGETSINLALTYPALVKSLVLSGSAVGGYEFEDEDTIDVWEEVGEALQAGDLSRGVELEVMLWVVGSNRTEAQVDDAIQLKVGEMILRSYTIPSGEGIEEELEPPAIDRLSEIKCPTLVLIGDHDVPDMQVIAEMLASGIEGAKKVVISNTAHLPNMEKPDEFNQLVLDFLKEV
ncbi:MAG: alpha/beta hydrolase [Anaerolineales bacterium]|nr:alpha/beta hydrolase [Anaerolineales bacterium]